EDGNSLSNFGTAVLTAWERFGVATGRAADEFARHLLLLLEAAAMPRNAIYDPFFDYWNELSGNFDPFSLIDSWDVLYVINYLDYTRDGFSPGQLYRKFNVKVSEIEFDLVD